jgi:hypothetical protein
LAKDSSVSVLGPSLTNQNFSKLSPWFITGFSDGEGCFGLTISQSKRHSIGWNLSAYFAINIHVKDKYNLELIRGQLGDIGKITTYNRMCVFRVSSIKELVDVVIPHFDKYFLLTEKASDYLLWKEGVLILDRGEHRAEKGLQLIVNLKASINWGLSPNLQKSFPNTKPADRSVVLNKSIPDPQWVAGFTTGEGFFCVNTPKSSASKLGRSVSLEFQLTQHTRDELLMSSFVGYFGCGNFNLRRNKDFLNYRCTKFSDIENIIIPFYREHPILGRVAEIMNKGHLTKEGLDQIMEIKANMNKGRLVD